MFANDNAGVAVQNNVGYNITGHCYFLEEVQSPPLSLSFLPFSPSSPLFLLLTFPFPNSQGSETYNTYIHNLGMVINNGPMIPSDSQASVYWITNPVCSLPFLHLSIP